MLNTDSKDFVPPITRILNLKTKKKYWIHIGLFLLTFITTTFAGVEWTTGSLGPYSFEMLLKGLPYSFSILFIITCHEFGHYFAAKYHRVEATLPYYIPFPPILGFLNFGTMGAVIKTVSPVKTKKAMFDIGIAGPIAGFIATLIILIYGFLNVPGEEYILAIHPDYNTPEYGTTGLQLVFGDTILFSFLKYLFVDGSIFFPPMSEIYHYPFLCVGWFGLLITAMNMIPVGQLDGGHISYTMFGEKNHFTVAVIAFVFLFIFGISGFADSMLELNMNIGWSGWLLWALILYFFVKLKHPPIADSEPVGNTRMLLGYISFIIFILSFAPSPIIITSAGY
ncbi:MAG: site-2 protease family protein [Ignavibacteriaceae bacterium]|nr:site-2 protease family protein [Ignavibacteriaceae bacterium]